MSGYAAAWPECDRPDLRFGTLSCSGSRSSTSWMR